MSPSPRQQLLSGLFHVMVLTILLLANLPSAVMIVLGIGVAGLYLRQRFVLAKHGDWRLRFEQNRWQLDRGDGALVAMSCDVQYLSRWLVVLRLGTGQGKSHHLALFSDGMPGEDWRQLHVIARAMVRKPQGRLTMMS